MSIDLENIMTMLLDNAKKHGADAADAIVAGGVSEEVSVRLGKLESIERSEDRNIGLRVFVDGRNAIISTASVDPESIDELAARAVAMARLAPQDPYAGLADKSLLADAIPDLDLMDRTIPSSDTLKDLAFAVEDAAQSNKGITNSEGGNASYGTSNVMLATTNGFAESYERSGYGLSTVALAEHDGKMERDYDYSSAVHFEDLKSPQDIGKSAAQRTLSRLGAHKVKTGSFPVIYDQRVSASISGHIASAINGSAIARGTSFLKDQLGEQITSAAITLTDDPLRPRGAGSSSFDGEGLARRQRVMVENGVLNGWFLDLASARQLDLAPMGNASRGTSSAPSPSTSNWMMTAGQMSRDELIASIDEGFLVTELIGSSVNLITGDYSRGASGFWIEKGQITTPVTEGTIAGNLKDMLMTITPANDLDFTRSNITPSLRIDGMTVAGG
ncbi:MAG TPA: modulator protein [Alphaproteobacteria bacterium]|nr:modulator protein [Alphaproteobacteria bacterium]|tara:strand:- start:396 stop:1733 length:1338 start_codon:yes stop_codon:yes gene_type:complete